MKIREDTQVTRSELKRTKQQVLHFLLRHGYQYTEGTNWTQKHRVWISSLKFKTQMEEETLSFYMSRMQSLERMCGEILGRIEEIAAQPEYEKRVRKLKAFKGIRSLIALSFIVDIGDFRRFVSAAQFMAFLGLVPSEHSSGKTRRQGGITKAGNSHLRRLLVEAAWCYRSYHPTSATLLKRREGLPAELIRYADRAGRRLNRKYLRLLHRGKPSQVAMIAVTRELAGFVWGAMVEQAA